MMTISEKVFLELVKDGGTINVRPTKDSGAVVRFRMDGDQVYMHTRAYSDEKNLSWEPIKFGHATQVMHTLLHSVGWGLFEN